MKQVQNWFLGGLLAVMLAGGALAADFQKGLDAANAGDYATALAEWTPLAEAGDADAQYNLGIMYDNGRGVPQDDAEAVKWFRIAAEAGYVDAQYNLGVMYDNGEGVLQDDAEAVKWYRLAAEAGYPRAQNNLGFMYEKGEGVLQDDRLAYMWYNIAAAQGLELAKENRDKAAKRMTPTQRSEAQEMSRRCLARNYKNC